MRHEFPAVKAEAGTFHPRRSLCGALVVALSATACGDPQALDAKRPPDVPARADAGAGGGDLPGDVPRDGGAPPGDAARETAAPPWTEPYAVLSVNLHCLKTSGTAFATNAERLAVVAAAAKAEGISVILAQEVCRRPGESALDLLVAALDAETGASWSAAWTFVHKAWEASADEADEGVAVLARGRLSAPTTKRYWKQGTLSRAMLGVDLPDTLGALRVYSVHLDHADATARARQASETAAVALAESDPHLRVLVGGDVNDRAGSEAHGAFAEAGYRDLTSSLDATRIDHLFAHRGAPLAASDAKMIFDGKAYPPVSDHPGVLVRLAPGAGEEVHATRVVATTLVPHDHYVAVRGSASPLSWARGVPAFPIGPMTWKAVFTELAAGPFEFKLLRDDAVWQRGDNEQGRAHGDNAATPSFP